MAVGERDDPVDNRPQACQSGHHRGVVEQLPVIFTMDEALRAGFTADQVRRKVARGEWVALRAGVYATAGALARVGHDDRRRHWIDVAAAQRAIRVPAWASHESAAFLQGLPMPRAPRDVVRLTCLPGGRGSRWEPPRPGPTPRPGLLIRRAAMPAGHR